MMLPAAVRAPLAVAGAATACMGAFHFILPELFGWARFTETLPAEIRWALFAMNAFLSMLLLGGGLATIVAIRRMSAGTLWLVGSMTAFWIFNTAYQLVRPFPNALAGWFLLGFALTVTFLYLIGLIAAGLKWRVISPAQASY